MTDNPPCPYCGSTVSTETVYSHFEDKEYEYACNTDKCPATVWDESGWQKEQSPRSMVAGYL